MTDRLKARLNASRMWGDMVADSEDKHFATNNFECGAMWGEKSTIADACEWIKENIGRYTNGDVDTERMCKDFMVQMQ